MALYEFLRRMIFGTDLSPKKIILKGSDLLDPYLTRFQFKVELENALLAVYAHPEQCEELRTSLAAASVPLDAVHTFIQAALRKQETQAMADQAKNDLQEMLKAIDEGEQEFSDGVRSAWKSILYKMESEKSENETINRWINEVAPRLT